jgi:hypothetical protein
MRSYLYSSNRYLPRKPLINNGVTNKGDAMTQQEFDKAVALVIEARKIIKELRAAELIKDSYNTIINASLNGIEKKLRKVTPEVK